MRRHLHRWLLGLATLVSLGLTAMTLWAVWRQGDALREREWSDLRNAALRAQLERSGQLRADLRRTFDIAESAWGKGGPMTLTLLASAQPRDVLVLLWTRDGGWQLFEHAAVGGAFQPLPVQPAGSERLVLAASVAAALENNQPWPQSGSEPFFFVRSSSAAGPRVTFVRNIAGDADLALSWSEAALRDFFLRDAPPDRTWALLPLPDDRPVLAELGDEFGGAVLTPSEAAETARLKQARQRWQFLAATGVATATAWGLVIFMLARVMARQRELVRLQRRFVADVSHELKTPLALIRLLAETLRDQRVREPGRMQDYHETITRESERLTVLLDNILDFSKIESGRKEYEFKPCDIGEVARQAWSLFEPQFAANGFDARLEIDENLPTVVADPLAIQQVIVNLLQNAYRYSGEGLFVRLRVAQTGLVIVISVEDHGIGMSRAQLQELGASFYRAADPRVRQTRGTGLGLAIVNHIITAHRGKLEVESRLNQGSKFTVWFPFQPPGGREAAR